jgi:peroxiredoxin
MNNPRTCFLFALLQLLVFSGLAQSNAVIKGTVIHPVNDLVIVSVDDLLENRKDSMLVSDSGYFKQEIAVGMGNYITISFPNQDFRFPVLPGDTVDLTFDESLLTYNLAVNNTQRKREITAVLDNTALFDTRLEEIYAAAEKGSDSLLTVIYNQQLKDFLQRIQQPSPSIKQTIFEIYYRHLTLWLNGNPVYALKQNEKIIGKELYNKYSSFFPSDREYQTLNEPLFYTSDHYRNFLLNYTNTDLLFTKSIKSDSTRQDHPINHHGRFHTIIGDVHIPVIRDWLIINYLKGLYHGGSYADALRLSDEYKPICHNTAIKESIKRMDAEYGRIKNGNAAPDFTLEDIDGNKVSLSSLKGKWVYLNFWSLSSSASTGNFMKYDPVINEKYKDKNIVFLNICFEEDAAKWRKKVKDLNIGGVNVIARGFTNLKICKDYKADSLPRTFLIDKTGNINSNQMPVESLVKFDESVINEWLQ